MSFLVQRHGSIIIIALGEVIVELGAGPPKACAIPTPVRGVVTVVVLGVLVSATLWWTYFGLTAGAEERLQETPEPDRARLAREAYSYLHRPLIVGIVFFAVGTHAAVQHFADPLPPLPALALTGGVALFYVADVVLPLA
jgi:low temperature requirement protein LtrA